MSTDRRYPLHSRVPPLRADETVTYAAVLTRPIMDEEMSSDESQDSDIELLSSPRILRRHPSLQDHLDFLALQNGFNVAVSPLAIGTLSQPNEIHDLSQDDPSDNETDLVPDDGGEVPGINFNAPVGPLAPPRAHILADFSRELDLEMQLENPPTVLRELMETVDGLCLLSLAFGPLDSAYAAPGLSYQQRAGLIIAEIHRLRGDAVEPVAEDNALPPTHSNVPTADLHLSLYFVGVQTPMGSRTFVQPLQLAAPDSTLLTRLIAAGRPLGRALGRLGNYGAYLVGTAKVPIAIEADYMSHRHNFRELGSWHDMQTSPTLGALAPVPHSRLSSDLLTAHNMDLDADVYVLYVYHEDADTLTGTQPALNAAIPLPPTAVGPAVGPTARNSTTEYLRGTFPAYFERITHAQATYGTAYQHCLIERYIGSICREVGIVFGRTITPGRTTAGLDIYPNDVSTAAGIAPTTFSSYRTDFTKARKVRTLLQRYRDLREQGPVPGVDDQNEVRFGVLLPMLDAMLGPEILAESFLSDTSGGPEAQAVSQGITPFQRSITNAIRVLEHILN
ncbi:hypothetical protein DFH07DRAFT_972031 [Mycena maculata]|uniref:Uncharacterized protein n=1 Tax=Mycena maculata TaxID=230809 RepID=A0AAD7ML69_9AGAR|nr:hypothetical protein DFH07DRAFT_972031 [Mycena maculata]